MENDSPPHDFSNCDLGNLPEIISWPSLCSQAESIEKLSEMGALENLVVKDVLSITPRRVHALPLSENIDNIGSSSLKLPWWIDLEKPNSLLPGLFETCQIFQMMGVSSGNKILLIGPRGNWWTEIFLHMGASKINIIEIDDYRRETLKNRWENLRLDIVSKALNCDIEWNGLEYFTINSDKDLYDRILITGGLNCMPTQLFNKLKENGEIWAPIGNNGETILHRITKTFSENIDNQNIAIWDVDMLGSAAENIICHGNKIDKKDVCIIEESSELIREAWLNANNNPTKDRIGPNSLLKMIKEVWESTDILLEYDNITLKDSIAKDLFKMGNVLQKIGIFELAAEHHGTSFSISPSAESACYLGMTFPINNDDSLAWQRVAIETDPNFGESWNEIGELMMKKGLIDDSINWFRGAIVSKNYSRRGEAWINLTRAHMEINQTLSAFFSAQKAVEMFPDNDELVELLTYLGEDLI